MARTRPLRTRFSGIRLDYSRMTTERRRAGLTQAQVAHAVGVSTKTINRLELNRHDPTHGLVVAVGRALGVPYEKLWEVTDDVGA